MAPDHRPHRAASLLIAIAAVAVVALAPAKVLAAPPTAGTECGTNQGSVWMQVAAKDLAAAGGGAVDANGCITSDGEPMAFVRAEFERMISVSEVYFKATSTGPIRRRDANASVIVGDVDLADWIEGMRTGKQPVKRIMQRQYECMSFVRSKSEQEVQSSCTPAPGAETSGYFVSVLARNTRICNLMVRA